MEKQWSAMDKQHNSVMAVVQAQQKQLDQIVDHIISKGERGGREVGGSGDETFAGVVKSEHPVMQPSASQPPHQPFESSSHSSILPSQQVASPNPARALTTGSPMPPQPLHTSGLASETAMTPPTTPAGSSHKLPNKLFVARSKAQLSQSKQRS